jgi:hypothetical protein
MPRSVLTGLVRLDAVAVEFHLVQPRLAAVFTAEAVRGSIEASRDLLSRLDGRLVVRAPGRDLGAFAKRAGHKVMAVFKETASGADLFVCTVFVSAYFDQCQQHSTKQSRTVAHKINNLVSAKKAFSVQAVTERRPTFYCVVGPKSDMSDIQRFARTINYEIPAFQFYLGFWNSSGRLLLFYEGFVLDVPIPF